MLAEVVPKVRAEKLEAVKATGEVLLMVEGRIEEEKIPRGAAETKQLWRGRRGRRTLARIFALEGQPGQYRRRWPNHYAIRGRRWGGTWGGAKQGEYRRGPQKEQQAAAADT